MISRIVITGGPASGKTQSINRFKDEPEFANILFFDELARKLLSLNPEYKRKRKKLHYDIYTQQVAREDAAFDRSFITDRGTADTFAFHPATMRDVNSSLDKEYKRYTAVFFLESTAALPGKEYQTDDVRRESAREAIRVENNLKRVWRKHPRYRFISASADFESKYNALLSAVKNEIS